MKESVLFKIQNEITSILLENRPDDSLQVFSRTKGDTENDIINSLATLSMAVAVLDVEVEKGLGAVSALMFEKATIELRAISNVGFGSKYSSGQIVEWVAGLLHHERIQSAEGVPLVVDKITPFVVSDDAGHEIPGVSGTSITFTMSKIQIPKIKRISQ